ncbi:MAG: TauD/TfdA family dioxygenase [Alphaproteobacteria bacterium]|nr:TauD/TfdA family dioxygenase [Alphaproteobacteria bacterium]
MAAKVWPVTESFAAEIGDVDLSQPLSDADWQAIDEAYRTYAVLIFPDQRISHDDHIAFARRFGPMDMSMMVDLDDKEMRVPVEIADVSNLDAAGRILPATHRLREFQHGNRLWHTDSSFKEVPANASLLYIQSIPPVGGQTEFADMRAAYDALTEATKRKIEGKVAMHSIATSRSKLGFAMTEAENAIYPRVPQVMVRNHAHNGRKSVYVASHAGEIVGMPDEEARALLAELMAHATQRQFVYCHRWRTNDLVVWDNRCTMHRGLAFDDLRWPRDAQRATTLDVASTCEQEGITIAAE